ncbi:fungal-specific transcription factor domain-containing protein [Phascolomyces articulosus]|uniref:Fungal-specific transcription factor domain-containing protein n=1 Tax=Phascolomyces articulosus TaxID=60185 RepID=A0AAD5P6U0_9FUNG|nr:fungal-specific transcription factor domain-containing protein [Phascolomyces articulosus]
MYLPSQQQQQTLIPRSATAPKSHSTIQPPPNSNLEGSHTSLPIPTSLSTEDSTMDPTRQKRTKKDRACDLCRRKKIRCDYSQAYPQLSCTSCKSYGKQCTFNEAAKKRGPPKGYVEGLENRLRRMEEMLMNVANAGRLSPESYQDLIQEKGNDISSITTKKRSEKRQKISPPSPTSSTGSTTMIQENASSHNGVTNPLDNNNADPNNNNSGGAGGSTADSYSYVGSSSGFHLLGKLFPKNSFPSHSNICSSDFAEDESDMMVERLPEEPISLVSMNDIESSHQWELPHKDVVDRLIELYFKKMNVFIPIVDEADFYEEYRKETGSTIPRNLILAICRASARLLDEDDWVIKKHNINRTDLFVALADALICENIDFMSPTIDKIQILLLSSCSARKWAAESTDWLGISLAVKMAQDLGLHRSNTQLGIPSHKMEARKRLWWSAYVLDRWICATLGRPLTISDADCDVELPMTEGNNQYAFIRYFTTLSAILGDILRILCSPRARSFSDKRRGMDEIYRSLNTTLEEWDQRLPNQWKFSATEMERIGRKDLDYDLEIKLNFGAGQLRLAYYSVLLLLKRPFVATSEGNEFEVPDECYDAIQSILNIAEVMQVKSMLSFSWSLTSYIMFQVLIVTLLLLRSPDQQIATNAEKCVERLLNQYRRLETYIAEPSVIPVLEILERLVKDTNNKKEDPKLKCSSSSSSSSSTSHEKNASSTSISSLSGIESTASSGEVTRASATGTTEQQQQYGMPLWGASSGLDWQDLMDILADSGYQALKGK